MELLQNKQAYVYKLINKHNNLQITSNDMCSRKYIIKLK